MSESLYLNFYPPIPNAELKNCHGYDGIDRVVVTKYNVWARRTNGIWIVVRELRDISE